MQLWKKYGKCTEPKFKMQWGEELLEQFWLDSHSCLQLRVEYLKVFPNICSQGSKPNLKCTNPQFKSMHCNVCQQLQLNAHSSHLESLGHREKCWTYDKQLTSPQPTSNGYSCTCVYLIVPECILQASPIPPWFYLDLRARSKPICWEDKSLKTV